MKAIYIIQHKNMLILIPKRRGRGFLKSCMGWHHLNSDGKEFLDTRPEWFTTGDFFDIDGYLRIELRLNTWDEDFKKGIQELIECLKAIFPHVTSIEENEKEFWDYLIPNKS